MEENYCTGCGKWKRIKAIFMCKRCFTDWCEEARLRNIGKGLQ